MSQRGPSPKGKSVTKTCSTTWWAHIRITVALSAALILGITLTLPAQEATPPAPTPKVVTLRMGGTERQVSTVKETVQTLFHQEDIALNEHDRCVPPLTAPITDGMTITVVRVTCEKMVENTSLPAPVVTRWDHRMTTKPLTVREGKPGTVRQVWVVWKIDGVVSQKWVQERKVLIAPKPTIVVRGSLPSRGLSGRKVMTMVATAYTPHDAGCSGWTATGMRAVRGVIAVDPRVIPLGTRVYVDGYGPAIAADTGGAIRRNIIDVCFPTRAEAFRWGRRTVKVVIME